MSVKIVYKDYNQNESLLFPPTLGELVPENHPVRIVNAVIDRLDISVNRNHECTENGKENAQKTVTTVHKNQ